MDWVQKIDLPMAEKFLLRVIEGHAREGDSCQLKAKTVAKEMGCSVRTIFRTVNSCVESGLLKFVGSRSQHESSEYEINWIGVGRTLLNNPETAAVVDPMEAAVLADLGVVTHDTVSGVMGLADDTTASAEGRSTDDNLSGVETITDDMVSSVTAAVTHDNLSATYAKLSRTHDNLSTTRDTVSCVSTLYPRERARTRSLNHDLNQRIKPCREIAGETAETPEQPTGGWPHPIMVDHLQNRDSVQRLWRHALKCKYVTPDLRVKFFALAKYTSRMARAGEVQNAGAYFTSQLSGKNWLGDHQDVKAAINAIAMLDGSEMHANA